MAIDTHEKRLSLIGYGVQGITLTVADGSFDQGDRQHFLGLYAGILEVPAITGPAGLEYTVTGRPADFTLEVSRLDYTTTGRPADFTLDTE